jgi:hypothetical protein
MGKIRRVLLASYGGGHVQSLIPLAHGLRQLPGVELEVIGFTTARAAFSRAGIEASGYRSLLEEGDEAWLALARLHKPNDAHADIDAADSLAYHALGLRDLVIDHGEREALRRYGELGRKAFLPVNGFRRYLARTRPDLVITSTSPRSELALQYAANDLGIPGLAVSDLFLQNEARYICTSRYARHITVIARYVADFLNREGCETTRIHVTGNPAFDRLTDPRHQQHAAALRAQLGFAPHENIVLWVCASAAISMIGKPFVDPDRMIAFLENHCANTTNTRYLVRQHPNNPVVGDRVLRHGVMCPPGVEIETCIQLADVVLLETSTVGLQAALMGKPVVSINAGDYPPYARLGLSSDVAELSEAGEALRAARKPELDPLGYSNLGHSAEAILALITPILEQREYTP